MQEGSYSLDWCPSVPPSDCWWLNTLLKISCMTDMRDCVCCCEWCQPVPQGVAGWPLTPHSQRPLAPSHPSVVECHPTWGHLGVWRQRAMFNVQPKCCQTELPNTRTLTPAVISLSTTAVGFWLLPSLTASGLPHDCSYVLSVVISALQHILHIWEDMKPTMTSTGPFGIML